MDKDNRNKALKRTKRASILIFALLILAACAATLGYSAYMQYDKQLENEAELLRISAGQAAAGLDLQFAKLEDASVTLLANRELTDFDAADRTQDEYEISRTLADMTNVVTGLSLIDNYCDFTLIYRNDAIAGNLSSDTRDLLCNDSGDVYPLLKELLGETHRRWVTGINGNYDKVFYISQANDHALFLGGFYTDELRYMLTPADKLEGSVLMLTDGEGHAIMSLGELQDDGELPDKNLGDSFAQINDRSVTAGKTLKNGWRVVMIKDMTDTLELYKRLAMESSVVLVLMLAVLCILYMVNSGADPAYSNGSMIAPDIDMLTGVTNAEEAENIMADRLETCVSGSTFMLAMVRIINLDGLEKRYGRSGYNGAIIKTFRGLVEFFGTEDPESKNILGRTGDGEFLVLADYTQYDLFKANDSLKESLIQLSEAMNSLLISEAGDIQICIGAAVYPHNSTDYDSLYDMAEKALGKAVDDDEKSYALYKKDKGTHK